MKWNFKIFCQGRQNIKNSKWRESVLTDNDYQKSRNYWKWLKGKLNEEESELVSKTNQLKMKSTDGKFYNTDVMDIEQILRLIQSIKYFNTGLEWIFCKRI